jgi:hypothetical protein
MANQESRQGINNITLTGAVKEHKLTENTKDGNKSIGGSIVIKTGEFSEIELKVFVGEKNKDGKPKKAYETLKKFITGEHLTMASAKDSEDVVSKVKIFGNKDFTPHIKEEIYKSNEEVKTTLSMNLGFGTIIVDNSIKEEDYKAEFEIEMFVTSVTEEVKKDETTGRAVITGWTPLYGGKVMPMKVVAGVIKDEEGNDYDFAQDILSQVEEGMTINTWGNIDYKSIITKVKKGGGLGKAKIEESREYIHDFVIEGADIQENEEKEFDMELIKKAKIERDTEIENIRNEESKDDKKTKGLSGGVVDEKKPKRERPKF